MSRRVKIIEDEFMRDVKVSEILGLEFTYTISTTTTTLALKLDPNGPEKLTIVFCMDLLLDGYIQKVSRGGEAPNFDQLRLILESYISRSHDVFLCMSLGRTSIRSKSMTKDVTLRLMVSRFKTIVNNE